jgi:hypothetical protein
MPNRSITLLIFLLPALILTASSQTPAPKSPTEFEKTLISAENNFIAAVKKGDPEFFQRTLADDFQFVPFDGQVYERQDMLDQFGEGGLDLLAYNMKVIPISDTAAIVTYDVVLRVPPEEDQGPPPRYQHFSTTWVKQGDVWKIKFQQMTVSHWGDW